MKVLLLQSKPFLPIIDGGNEASRALTLELISSGYQVDCLTFSSEKHPFLENLFKQEPWNKIKIDHALVELKVKPIPAFRALTSGKSYNLSRFSSADWQSKLEKKASSGTYDIILIDSLFASNEIELIRLLFPKSKLIFRPHNVEFKLWSEHAENEKSFLKKMYLKSIARQLKKREIEILQFFDLILPISSHDEKFFKEITDSKIALLPYFPDIPNDSSSELNTSFFFMGSMNWTPNIEAHNELCEYIFPKIKAKINGAILTFAGGSQDEIQKSNVAGIEYAGFIKDKIDFLNKAGILLAPISSGSGVRVKLIEAMAQGVPIVTTEKGAEGIPFKSGDGLLIAKNEFEFVDYAVKVNTDEKLRSEISKKAQENILSWKSKYKLKSIFDENV